MISTLAYVGVLALVLGGGGALLLLGRWAYRRLRDQLIAFETALQSLGASVQADRKQGGRLAKKVVELKKVVVAAETTRVHDRDVILQAIAGLRADVLEEKNGLRVVDETHNRSIQALREALAEMRGRLEERERRGGLALPPPGQRN